MVMGHLRSLWGLLDGGGQVPVLDNARQLGYYCHSCEALMCVSQLVTLVHVKDRQTAAHSKRVAQYCADALAALSVPQAEQQQMLVAAAIHDVGKLFVSSVVLEKPGLLDNAEMIEMQMHAAKGSELLRLFGFGCEAPGRFFRDCGRGDVADMVRHHHERWDGRGYPDRVRGVEIPWGARLIAVVDAVDAMLSPERQYRKSRTHAEVRDELRDEAGRQFDPDIVGSLLATGWLT